MKINVVVVGDLDENCYILEKDNKVLVIDPGDDVDRIKEIIGDKEVVLVLVTHNHFDHVGALDYFDDSIIYRFDNLEERVYDILPFKFRVIFTPGHSLDSVSYYFEEDNVLFGGDFIFYRSIGRWDLAGGNYEAMLDSIDKIKKYPSNMVIYPGHGISTVLKDEIRYNGYFR